MIYQGRIQDFKLGGGAHLRKLRRAEGGKERLCLIIDKCRSQKLCKRAQKISAAAQLRVIASTSTRIPDLLKHIFLSQTDLTRTGIISNSYNEMFEA
jgi:hypothetical protein